MAHPGTLEMGRHGHQPASDSGAVVCSTRPPFEFRERENVPAGRLLGVSRQREKYVRRHIERLLVAPLLGVAPRHQPLPALNRDLRAQHHFLVRDLLAVLPFPVVAGRVIGDFEQVVFHRLDTLLTCLRVERGEFGVYRNEIAKAELQLAELIGEDATPRSGLMPPTYDCAILTLSSLNLRQAGDEGAAVLPPTSSGPVGRKREVSADRGVTIQGVRLRSPISA